MAKSRKPQVLQNEVLARTLARQSKSRIAREMAIDRQTVTRIQECHNLPQLLADSRRFIVENVVPDAIRSLHAQIKDREARGDGDLAVRLLEKSGVLDGGGAPNYTIEGDIRLTQALQLIPQATWGDNAPPPPAAAQPAITVEAPAAGASLDAGARAVPESAPAIAAAVTARTHPSDC